MSVTEWQVFTNKTYLIQAYGTTEILSRRDSRREDAERRIRLARLHQPFSAEWQEEYAHYCEEKGLTVCEDSAAGFVRFKDEQLEAAMKYGNA